MAPISYLGTSYLGTGLQCFAAYILWRCDVLPSPNLGLHLRTAEWAITVKYRLGCPVFSTAGACPACNLFSDKEGDHAISCGHQGERIARHNHLRDTLYHTAVSASLGPTREDRALIPGTEARPADVLIPNWCAGKDAAMDVTVVNPLLTKCATHVTGNFVAVANQ